MAKKVLDFDLSKKRSKIGSAPAGKLLTPSETVTSLSNLPPSVQKALAFREALKEMGKLNAVIEDNGGDPINIDEKDWWQEAYKNTRGHMEFHPSPEWLAAFYRGETDD